jgi:hypothetical protein
MISIKENDYYLTTFKTSKTIPSNLQSCSTSELETVLELASEALKSLRESATTNEVQSIIRSKEQKHSSELEQLKQQYCSDELKYKKQIKEYHEQTLEQNKQQYQKQLRELQIQLEQSVQSYQVLNQNYLNLQNSSQETFNRSLSSAITSLESQHTKNIISLESKHNKVEEIYRNQIHALQESLDIYTKQAITQNISSNKGKSGEQSFDQLVEQFTTWSLENTSKTPQSCDRSGTIRGCKTLFEIKNYSANVPKKEVDKFKRDMEVHKDCPLGIFVSLTSNIVGAPQDFFFTEFSPSNQLFVYIQQFNNHDPSSLLSILDSLVELAKLFHSKCNDSEINSDIQTKVDSIKPIFDIQIKNIANIIKELNNHSKFMIDSIQKFNISIKSQLDSLNLSISSMFQTLFQESNMIIDSGYDNSDVPPPPKKKQVKRKNNSQNNQTVLSFPNISTSVLSSSSSL